MEWKTAILRPLLKKSNLPLIYKNYRPVSNLPFISKIAEKSAMGILEEHCTLNMLNSDYQSAYKKGFSCETLLLKIVNDILWAMENKQITALVMLDLSAAFDTVDHDILLQILENKFGVKDKALDWFRSYLQPRNFKVCVKQYLFKFERYHIFGPSR